MDPPLDDVRQEISEPTLSYNISVHNDDVTNPKCLKNIYMLFLT